MRSTTIPGAFAAVVVGAILNRQTEVYFGIGGLALVSVRSWTIRRHAGEKHAVEVFDGENGGGMIVACGTLTAT